MHIAITGASSGIGEALAKEYAQAGAKLTLVARRGDLLEKLSASVGGAHLAVCDLSEDSQMLSWLSASQAANGPIDILINNAGMENTGPSHKADLSKAEQLLRLNVQAPTRLMHTLLAPMLERKSGGFINVSSLAAIVPLALQPWYSASKGALANFSEALRSEFLGKGLKVLTVYPGPVKTAMGDSAFEAFGGRKGAAGFVPEGTPEELARITRRAFDKDKGRVIYPSFYHVARWFPSFTRFVSDRFSPRPTE